MDTTHPLSFGDYVKEAREHQGYSVRHLATLLGVAPSTIARIEYNTFITPGPDLVLALIKNLDLDPVAAIGLLESYQRLTQETLPTLTDYLKIKYKMAKKDTAKLKRHAQQLGYSTH